MYKYKGKNYYSQKNVCKAIHADTGRSIDYFAEDAKVVILAVEGVTWEEPEAAPDPTTEELYNQAIINRLMAYQSRSDCKFMEFQFDLMKSTCAVTIEAQRLVFEADDPATADAELAAWNATNVANAEQKRLDWIAEVESIKEEFTLPELEFLRDEGLLP